MKIYTRTGDEGSTGVIGGRVSKDDIRVEAYGTIDELNAMIGEAIARITDSDLIKDLTEIQHQLFDAGADLAQTSQDCSYKIKSSMINILENHIDRYEQECQPLQNFILPGGTKASTILHICRVVTRRAERRVVTLCKENKANEEVRRYLNRLSDLFFVLARTVNARAQVADVNYRS